MTAGMVQQARVIAFHRGAGGVMRFFVTPRSAAFCILGLLCAFVGLIYLTVTAPALPSFLPGHVPHAQHPHTYYKRAVPLLAVAAVALYLAHRISKRALHDY